ncbi:MAG: radical SAM protein [Muribaculaceae bacterium]|nr:radical SAM protein [Muribaculaceae bacterium]
MHCQMCNIWAHPTTPQEEITPKDLEKLPRLKFINITGGEPFVRDDLDDIVRVCYTRAPRIVISTSGWFSDRVIDLARKFPQIGIRVSIEGLAEKNDELRGRQGGFDRGLRTLTALRDMGIKDIGFGCTVSNHNSSDMLALYQLAKEMNMEFATAAFHNSFYFHKYDNEITNRQQVTTDFTTLVNRQLHEKHPKAWFRAYFNMGLINYLNGEKRLLPCEAGTMNFFVDPWGEVWPCNGLEEKYWMESMGNLRTATDFDTLWNSEQAEHVRSLVANCPKQCWMVGTVSPVMHKYIVRPTAWVLRNKLRALCGKEAKLIKQH